MELIRADQELTAKGGVDALLSPGEAACVSIYLKTGCRPDTRQEAVARLKTLLESAQTQLKAAGHDSDMLDPVRQLVNDDEAWPYQGKAAALFVSQDSQALYSLPYSCTDRAFIDGRYYVVPLLPIVDAECVFYVVALSQENTRLLRATPHGMTEVDLGDVPTSLKSDLRHDVFETSLQMHTGSAATTGGEQQSTMFHGHGAAGDKANIKRKLHHMFEHIDNAVCDRIGPENAPVVLAGLDYMQGVYRDLNHCRQLLKQGVQRNTDDMSDEDIHQAAWQLVEPLFERGLSKRKDRYQVLAGNSSERADSRIETVVLSALNKRVETLFVEADSEQWGTVDVANQSVSLANRQTPGATELVNLAVTETLANGGEAYGLEAAEMPVDGPLAAIYRF